jgi:hypothetical protein
MTTTRISVIRRTLVAAAHACFVALPLSACGSKIDSPIVGDWSVSEIDGVPMGLIADLTGEDAEMTFEFKANGKMTAEIPGESGSGTYTITDTQITMTIQGDKMVCDYVASADSLALNNCDAFDGSSLTLVPAN